MHILFYIVCQILHVSLILKKKHCFKKKSFSEMKNQNTFANQRCSEQYEKSKGAYPENKPDMPEFPPK